MKLAVRGPSNAVSLRATDTVDMQRLLKATMRLRPDRIIVGEVRRGEALSGSSKHGIPAFPAASAPFTQIMRAPGYSASNS